MANGLTPQEVLEKLFEGEFISKQELADYFECSTSVIVNRINRLRDDGHSIIFGNEGLKAVTREMIEKDPENAMCLENMMNWMMGSIYGLQRTMLPNKKLLPAMRRSLAALGYSKGERQVLLKECAKITSMLIMIDSQDALDDE